MSTLLNWADYCVIGVLVLSVLMGLWRGFIGEVLALACWILAFWIAWHFGAQLADKFTTPIPVPSVRLILAYVICFVGVLILGALVGFFMRKLIAGSGLSGSDRLLGMFFGLARGLLLVTFAVLILGFTPFPRDPWWHDSQLLPSFQAGAEWLSARLPPDVTKYLDLRGLLPIPAALPPAAPAPVPASIAPPIPPPPAHGTTK